MTSTHEAFTQIQNLLEAKYKQTAWNVFTHALREAHDAGYDAGVQDTEHDYNTTSSRSED
jgi:hypothetical protein